MVKLDFQGFNASIMVNTRHLLHFFQNEGGYRDGLELQIGKFNTECWSVKPHRTIMTYSYNIFVVDSDANRRHV